MNQSIFEIPLRRMNGEAGTLDAFCGKVVLIVNVASACGLTPQYAALQKIYEEKQADGLVVAGFPANEFGAQEPGTNEEIAGFCSSRFGVTFPMFEKIIVKGPGQHPLYRQLIEAQPLAQENPGSAFRAKLAEYGIKQENQSDILWNFEKFLIGRNGKVVGRFAPDISPDDPALVAAIDSELAA